VTLRKGKKKRGGTQFHPGNGSIESAKEVCGGGNSGGKVEHLQGQTEVKVF